MITGFTYNESGPHVCCLRGIIRRLEPGFKTILSLFSALTFVLFFNRTDDSSFLCGGAVGWRDSDGRMRGKRGACRVCAGQEGYTLLPAGGDGSAGPRLLPQLGRSSPRSVRNTSNTQLLNELFSLRKKSFVSLSSFTIKLDRYNCHRAF